MSTKMIVMPRALMSTIMIFIPRALMSTIMVFIPRTLMSTITFTINTIALNMSMPTLTITVQEIHIWPSPRNSFRTFEKIKRTKTSVEIQLVLVVYIVLPFLVYGCENIPMLDNLHLNFLKYLLCIKQSTPTCMVLSP